MRLLLVALLAPLARARDFNISVDDQYGDERTGVLPIYSPSWTARSLHHDPCNTTCAAQPPAERAHNTTWHEWFTNVGDPPATLSINFTGTRIYVFFILFNQKDDPPTNTTRLSFFMDGSTEPADHFLHTFNPALEMYLFNQRVFSSDDMPLGNHTLELRSLSDGKTGSLAMFDYALYTTHESSGSQGAPLPPAPTPGGTPDPPGRRANLTLVGAVTGGVAGLLLLISAAWLYRATSRRRHRRRSSTSSSSIKVQAAVRPFIGHLPREEPALRVGIGSQDAPEKGSTLLELKQIRPHSAGSTQLRSEIQQMREELERVRQIAEPPEYAHE